MANLRLDQGFLRALGACRRGQDEFVAHWGDEHRLAAPADWLALMAWSPSDVAPMTVAALEVVTAGARPGAAMRLAAQLGLRCAAAHDWSVCGAALGARVQRILQARLALVDEPVTHQVAWGDELRRELQCYGRACLDVHDAIASSLVWLAQEAAITQRYAGPLEDLLYFLGTATPGGTAHARVRTPTEQQAAAQAVWALIVEPLIARQEGGV
jgi:hypothetical protein